MNKKILSIVLVLSMLVGMLAVMPISVGAAGENEAEEWDVWDGTADYSFIVDGRGLSASTPYEIATAEQWAGLANWANGVYTEKKFDDLLYYKLTANLDFDDNESLTPISIDGKKLGFIFDGNNKKIKGVKMNRSSDGTGLFGDVWGNNSNTAGKYSVIKNLIVEDSVFASTNGYVAAIVGEASGKVLIENVYVASDVSISSGANCVGGFVGGAYNKEVTITIEDCVFAGSVTSTGNDVGGFVGTANSGDYARHVKIYDSLMLGSVSGASYVGGFVGRDGASGDITIENSIYAGKSFGNYPFAQTTNAKAKITVTNSYTTVFANNDVAYKTEKSVESAEGVTLLGAITDIVDADALVCPEGWVRRTGDIIVPEGVADMDIPAYYDGGLTMEWTGKGTEASPYVISRAMQWRHFVEQSKSNTFSGKYIELGADITLNIGAADEWKEGNFDGVANQPVNSGAFGNQFEGNFNGKGHTISGAYIVVPAGTDGIALFGEVGNATISNFRFANSYIECDEWIGGVVGETDNSVTVSDIYVDKDVYIHATRSDDTDSHAQAGGIVGGIYGTGSVTVTRCVFAGTITAKKADQVSGILGVTGSKNNVTITDCLFIGTADNLGGGGARGITHINNLSSGKSRTVKIENCVSVGTADGAIGGSLTEDNGVKVIDCFWTGSEEVKDKFSLYGNHVSDSIMSALGENWTKRVDDFVTLEIFKDIPYFSLSEDVIGTTEWEIPYHITKASEWRYFIFLVQIEKQTFAGETIYLDNDISFGGSTIDPLAPDSVATFQGTFDGQGHTIRNFVIDDTVDATSLFGDIRGGAVIKNLVIDSATVYASQWAGVVVGEVSGEATIENVFVTEDVKLYSNRGTKQGEVGGIVGGLYGEGSVTVRGCVFAGEIYSNGKTVGGIVGRGNSLSVTIEDCLMLGSVECTLEDSDANGILGWNKDKVNTDKDTGEITSVQEGTTVIRNTVYAGWGYSSYSFGTFGENTTIENCYSTDAKYAYCIEVDQPEYGSVNHIEKTDIINNPELVAKLNNGRATDVWRLRGGDAIVPTDADVIGDDVYLINVHMFNGASVRFSDTSDIRFTGIIGSNYLESKKAEGKTVKFGILISLASYVELLGDNDFTPANLDALGEEVINGTRYVMIEATNYGGGEEDGYYIFSGVLWGLKSNTREYAARTYVQIIDDETGEIDRTLLSYYNPTDNNRSIAYVAKAAYEDTCNFSNGYYKHELAEGQGVYSPYTAAQREMLLKLFDKADATDISFLSYNVRNVEDNGNYDVHYEYTDRNEYVLDYLLNSGADIIGLQEVSALKADSKYIWESDYAALDWFDTIGNEYKTAGLTAAGYTCVSGQNIYTGDDYSEDLVKQVSNGKTMYNPIYFKTDKFEFVTSGTKWFAADPDTALTINGANTHKALNFVVLRDKKTGEEFIYVNLHLIVKTKKEDGQTVNMNVLDSYGTDTGHLVQELEVIYLRGILDALQKEYADLPMFVGGDFNNSYSGINKWFSKSVVGENPWDISEGTPEEDIQLSTAREQAITKSSYLYSCTTEDFTQVEPDSGKNIWKKWGAIDLWWTSNFTNGVVHCYQILDNKTTTSTGEKYPSDHLPAKMCVTIYKDNA